MKVGLAVCSIYCLVCLVVRLYLFIMHSSSDSVHTRLRSTILAILSCVRIGLELVLRWF
jgi:hypothetical protein